MIRPTRWWFLNPLEWAKMAYAAFGASYPTASLIAVFLLGGAVAAGFWSVAGHQYRKDQPKQAETSPLATQSPIEPSPKQAIESAKPTSTPNAQKLESEPPAAKALMPTQAKPLVMQDRSVHIESGSSVSNSPIITGDNVNVIVPKLPPPQMTRSGQDKLIGLLESADEQQLWVDIPYGGPTQEYASQIAGALSQVPKWKVTLAQITSWPREANTVTIGTSKDSTATSNAKLLHDALTAVGVANKWVQNMDSVNDPRYIIVFVPPPQ